MFLTPSQVVGLFCVLGCGEWRWRWVAVGRGDGGAGGGCEEMPAVLLQRIEQQRSGLRLTVCSAKFPRHPRSTRNFSQRWLLHFACASFSSFAGAAEHAFVRSPPPVPYPRSLTASTARVDCPRWHLPVCSLRSLQKSSLASAQAKKSEPLRTNWSPDCPPMGLFQECPRWGILTQPSNNPRLRFRSSRFRADFTQTQLRPPQPPMTRKRKASALQCKISIPFPRALQVYLLGLLAMIKCSICSYQCDN